MFISKMKRSMNENKDTQCMLLVKMDYRKKIYPSNFFFFYLKNFFYLFLAVLVLHCCTWAFSSCGVWTSHCSGLSLQSTCSRVCGFQQLWYMDLVVPPHVQSSQGLNPCPLHWQADSLTTRLPFYLKKPKTWTKYRKQMFSDNVQYKAQYRDLWKNSEKSNGQKRAL